MTILGRFHCTCIPFLLCGKVSQSKSDMHGGAQSLFCCVGFIPYVAACLNAGQFWNIPVSVSSYEPPSSLTPEQSQAIMRTRPYVVTVAYPGANTRSFTAYLYHRTWDKTASPCLYGGNSQGGPWSELPGPNDPLIEGTYKDYLTRDLFDVNYKFSKFEGVCSR